MPSQVLTPESLRAAALSALPNCAVFAVDHDLRLLLCDGPALSTHGYDPSKLVGRPLADVAPVSAYAELEPHYLAALQGDYRSFEQRSTDGERWYWTHIAPLMDGDEIVGAVAISQDISDRRRADDELRSVTMRFETAFAAAPIGMAMVGLDGRFLRANEALTELTGYPEEELMSLTFQDITHPADLTLDLNHLERLLSGEESSYTMEKRYVTKQGRLVWVLLAVSLVRDDAGEPSHFISQIKDITETREMEERLRELANHDPVTDLLNRRRFEDELVRQVGRCRRYGETACLLILDVDDFKGVNDALGHRMGDAALRRVATILKERLRVTDVVARVGGDEFAALLTGVGADDASGLAEQVRAAIEAAKVESGDQSVGVTASIGLKTLDSRIRDEDSAFVAADRAMYEAKAEGRNRVKVAPE
ncbi:MAG TPA: diguanylate cyclase [Thermoleophilaceae bacterium]|nr:diguanylate cyclase [Thermoleophilaceae bacterium]